MGLGKTLTSITFIVAILGSGGKEEERYERSKGINPVLVVAPASVIDQWSREIEKVRIW